MVPNTFPRQGSKGTLGHRVRGRDAGGGDAGHADQLRALVLRPDLVLPHPLRNVGCSACSVRWLRGRGSHAASISDGACGSCEVPWVPGLDSGRSPFHHCAVVLLDQLGVYCLHVVPLSIYIELERKRALSRVRLLRSHELWPARLLYPWDSPGKNTGVGCHFLLQGIFATQQLNPGLPQLQADALPTELCGKLAFFFFKSRVNLLRTRCIQRGSVPQVVPCFLACCLLIL